MSDGLDDAAETATEHVAASAADPYAPGAKARPSRTATLRPDAEPGHCTNCGTQLQGPVCHHCGQLADEFHRPVRGLLGEIIEGFFALDGRVARTIPNLLLRPGRITRAYLKGQRARFMPPFRLYIIASLVFFLLAPVASSLFDTPSVDDINETLENATFVDPDVVRDAVAEGADLEERLQAQIEAGEITQEEAEAVLQAASWFGLDRIAAEAAAESEVDAGDQPRTPEAPTGADPPVEPDVDPQADETAAEAGTTQDDGALQLGLERGDGTSETFALTGEDGASAAQSIRRYLVPEEFGEPEPEGSWPLGMRTFMADRLERIAEDPGRWFEEAAEWIPRIMFALVPVYALLLSLTYAWRRGFFLYDHLIVSVHFHAALFLSMTVAYLLSYVLPGFVMFAVWVIYSHIYLYKLHRVVYERGRVVAILRTLTLSFVYGIVLSLALSATLLLGALSV